MMDFDEVDLLRHCENAGFRSVRVELTIAAFPAVPTRWDTLMRLSGNPKIPSIGDAMQKIFDAEERARLERYARPVVEKGGSITRMANALLTATKDRAPRANAEGP